jgi:hypothetical protein
MNSRKKLPPPLVGDAPDTGLKGKPPPMIEWIAWFFEHWRRYWMFILVALLVGFGSIVYEAMGWSSEIRAWIACRNPDEMKRSLDCWK